LSERLYQNNNCEQQSNIDLLQDILDSPLFHTLYNLQDSVQRLKAEFEKGNPLIKNCSFNFDIEGHLKFINDQITKRSNEKLYWSEHSIPLCFLLISINLDIETNSRLSDNNTVRKVTLNKQTSNESLGINLVSHKHCLLDLYAVFIENIQANSLAHL